MREGVRGGKREEEKEGRRIETKKEGKKENRRSGIFVSKIYFITVGYKTVRMESTM